jgi:predicted oxidoreductase
MYDFSHDHIVRSVEGSLSRLGVDTLDVLLLHRPDPLVEPGEVARAFDELHQAGKVRSFGVSNHSAMQMELLQSSLGRPLVANQMEVSLDHPDLIVAGTAVNQRDPAHQLRHGDTLEYCRMEGVTIQAWSALAHGKFSGREQNDAAGLVDHLAGVYGTSREAIVLGWILRHPAPILPVVGTTNPDRIRASAAAPEVFLEREHWYALTEAARRMGMP